MSEELRDVRIGKLETLREKGVHPWPERFERSHAHLGDLRALEPELRTRWDEAKAAAAEGESVTPEQLDFPRVRVAGRLIARRVMGKLSFSAIQDISGRVQVSFERDKLAPEQEASREQYQIFKKDLDIGDFIGVEGPIYFTNKGEMTIRVDAWQFLGKALRPLPDKWAGVKDQEISWRKRYLDLIANPEARDRFRTRSRIVRAMRNYLDSHDFDEVETPVLCTQASGALARPFIAHHNSLDMEVFLRIAPETYLKRLIVAGYNRVYEFARCFRNEGMDPSHLQDFTMLEYYCAYWNYEDNMTFTRDFLQSVIQEVLGTLTVRYGEHELDFSGDWPRRPMAELIAEHSGIDINDHPTAEALLAAIDAKGIAIEKRDVGRGNLIDQLYKKTTRPKLIQPTFLIKHPKDLSPLARGNDEDETVCDRFQLVVNTWEIVNAYSELVDPIDQRGRLEDQARQAAAGDDEAMVMDEDYLLAMEYGMPPISGWGLGIDRFTALLTEAANLRDTVLFPLMRPKLVTDDEEGGEAGDS